MRIKNPPMIIDNTVVGRYGLTGRFDILEKLYGKNIVIPTQIIVEAAGVQVLLESVQAGLKSGWLEEYTLDFTKGKNELLEYAKIRKRFHYGECAVLAIAKTWNCTVASDDMTATRNYCKKNNIDQIGSLGILYDAFETELLNEADADKLLKDMIDLSEYRCPVHKFAEVIDWFKHGIGRELF